MEIRVESSKAEGVRENRRSREGECMLYYQTVDPSKGKHGGGGGGGYHLPCPLSSRGHKVGDRFDSEEVPKIAQLTQLLSRFSLWELSIPQSDSCRSAGDRGYMSQEQRAL